jgi:putative transcriptional regulator
MKSAFDKIAAGLGDAIAHANGETGRARVAAPIDVAASQTRRRVFYWR